MSDETEQPANETPSEEPVASEETIVPSPTLSLVLPSPLSTLEVLRKCLKILVIFGGIGFWVSLRSLARHTLPHILIMDGTFEFQEVRDAIPIPHLVAWNHDVIQWMLRIERLDGGPLLFAILGSLLLLVFQTIKILNPTFRIFSLAQSPVKDAQIGTSTLVLNQTVIQKLVLIFIRTMLPACAIWLLCTLFETRQPLLSYLIRWLAVGITFWVGFHREGMAGDFRQLEFQSIEESAHRLLLRGALFGAGAFLLQFNTYGLPSPDKMQLYHTLGTFHKGFWNQIATPYLLSGMGGMASIGLLMFAIGGFRLRRNQSIALSLLPIVMLVFLVTAKRGQSIEAFAKKRDINQATLAAIPVPYSTDRPMPAAGVPDGIAAGEQLLRALNIPRPTRETNPLLFFFPNTTAIAMQEHYTEDGLPTDSSTEHAVTDFLKQRNYETALSWVAFKHLFNIGAVNFDITTSLRYCIESLAKYPHVGQTMPVIRTMLFYCSASKENIAIIDQLADENQFICNDRPSLRMLGDLYVRVGEVQKALKWYRRADMPKTFLERIQKQKPMFHNGRVYGKFMLNGKPLAGMKVGVYPLRLNGLPIDIEPELVHTSEEMMGALFYSPRFPRFHPRPYSLRWVSAGTTTNANGEFTLENLTEGEYQVVVALPSSVSLNPPFDTKLQVKNQPRALIIGYSLPNRPVGTVEITAPLKPDKLKWEKVSGEKPATDKEPLRDRD